MFEFFTGAISAIIGATLIGFAACGVVEVASKTRTGRFRPRDVIAILILSAIFAAAGVGFVHVTFELLEAVQ